MPFSVALQASLCCLEKFRISVFYIIPWNVLRFLHSSVFGVKFHPHRLVKICDAILAVSLFLIHGSLLSNARFFHHFMHFSCTYSIPYIPSEVSIFNGFRWLYWCLKQSLITYPFIFLPITMLSFNPIL